MDALLAALGSRLASLELTCERWIGRQMVCIVCGCHIEWNTGRNFVPGATRAAGSRSEAGARWHFVGLVFRSDWFQDFNQIKRLCKWNGDFWYARCERCEAEAASSRMRPVDSIFTPLPPKRPLLAIEK